MLKLKPAKLRKHSPSSFAICTLSDTNFLNFHLDFFLSKHTPTLQSLLRSHALIITSGNSNNIFIASKLISLYASLKQPKVSTVLFHSIHPKDAFVWNSIIKSHFCNVDYSQALDLFQDMRASNILPNQFTVPMAVSTCAELMFLNQGMNIHGLALKLGLFSGNSAVGSSFIYMYSKCGLMENASLMFDEIIVRDVVAWTALVVGYVQNDESEKALKCLSDMHMASGNGETPNFRTLEAGFQACRNLGALVEGKCLHGFAVKSGIGRCQNVQSLLLSMYSKCGESHEAYLCFCELSNKDLLSWSSIIASYAKLGLMAECLGLFWEMQADEIMPDEITISCMISGFGNLVNVSEGKAFHGLILRRCYLLNNTVHNALLSMYCKFGCLSIAEKIFSTLDEKNKEAWQAMIVGYSNTGLGAKCLDLFREMKSLDIVLDLSSLTSVISSCSQVEATNPGRSLHCYILKNSVNENVPLANSLIDMYGKNAKLTAAWRIFCRTEKDIITWNTMISSYTHCGHFSEAIALFEQMISKNLKPNPITCVTVLSACAHLASLEKGEKVHYYIKQNGFEASSSLGTALVDMYAKCGQLEKARELFNSMEERDVVSWNVMISSYGIHGDAETAIEIFHLMEKSNLKPNGLTFLALLSACNHSGLLEEGKYVFGRMKDYSIEPNLKHYACIIDLLGRSGRLTEAEEMILSMPISPDGGVWGSLLSACKTHNEVVMGIRIAKLAIESDPENDGYYIMLSNMHTSFGRWDEAEKVRNMMKEMGVEKRAGWSAV